MFITNLTKKMEKENSPDADKLKEAEVLLLKSINQARDTARGLYPGELESASLIHSLQELTSRTQSQSEIICQFYCPKLIEINDAMATHLYRIAQEGITNAVKHGKAKNIEVSFIQKEGKITFMVKDNGQGITAHPDSECGIGLNIMKYRAHLMDATFHVEPNVPHGVILKFCFENIISQERDL
ncbi:MAG: Integral membrane sensor signal transduction histidine kinase [uncultured bacterium]|nr:MAG: Integral membrane sensor signal transduction histidine kinase [uncultured bacterium]